MQVWTHLGNIHLQNCRPLQKQLALSQRLDGAGWEVGTNFLLPSGQGFQTWSYWYLGLDNSFWTRDFIFFRAVLGSQQNWSESTNSSWLPIILFVGSQCMCYKMFSSIPTSVLQTPSISPGCEKYKCHFVSVCMFSVMFNYLQRYGL